MADEAEAKAETANKRKYTALTLGEALDAPLAEPKRVRYQSFEDARD